MYLSVRNRIMKIVVSTKDPRLRGSPGHSGQGFFEFYSPIRRGGAPSGAAAFIVTDG